ncbi:unnamed protein product, partial [Ixodes pacificus]
MFLRFLEYSVGLFERALEPAGNPRAVSVSSSLLLPAGEACRLRAPRRRRTCGGFGEDVLYLPGQERLLRRRGQQLPDLPRVQRGAQGRRQRRGAAVQLLLRQPDRLQPVLAHLRLPGRRRGVQELAGLLLPERQDRPGEGEPARRERRAARPPAHSSLPAAVQG